MPSLKGFLAISEALETSLIVDIGRSDNRGRDQRWRNDGRGEKLDRRDSRKEKPPTEKAEIGPEHLGGGDEAEKDGEPGNKRGESVGSSLHSGAEGDTEPVESSVQSTGAKPDPEALSDGDHGEFNRLCFVCKPDFTREIRLAVFGWVLGGWLRGRSPTSQAKPFSKVKTGRGTLVGKLLSRRRTRTKAFVAECHLFQTHPNHRPSFSVLTCRSRWLETYFFFSDKNKMDMEYDEISDDDLDELIENADADEEQEQAKPGQLNRFSEAGKQCTREVCLGWCPSLATTARIQDIQKHLATLSHLELEFQPNFCFKCRNKFGFTFSIDLQSKFEVP